MFVLVMLRGDRNRRAEGVALRRHGKLPNRFMACGVGGSGDRQRNRFDGNSLSRRLDQRSRGRGRLVGVADELQQVMIFDVLDLISEPNKAVIDVVEGATVKLIAELFAPYAERVPPGV